MTERKAVIKNADMTGMWMGLEVVVSGGVSSMLAPLRCDHVFLEIFG
jgi:hypothetical protein